MTNKDFNLSDHLPLVAIIRGVEPVDCIRVTQILIEEGFSMIEVPLNSPDALTSIKMLVEHFGDQYLIGAGTVTTPEKAQAVIDTGAKNSILRNLRNLGYKVIKYLGILLLKKYFLTNPKVL